MKPAGDFEVDQSSTGARVFCETHEELYVFCRGKSVAVLHNVIIYGRSAAESTSSVCIGNKF